jgi:hypothetical protein
MAERFAKWKLRLEIWDSIGFPHIRLILRKIVF